MDSTTLTMPRGRRMFEVGPVRLVRAGPLRTTSPEVREACQVCQRLLEPGDYWVEFRIGPGQDPHEQVLATEGRKYAAVTLLCHWACVTGETD